MNILIDKLPDSISIDGKEYRIHTDFRNWIQFEILMFDHKIPLEQKIIDLLKLCFLELPDSIESSIMGMIQFYSGDAKKEEDGHENNSTKQPIYSYKRDADYIYSAFLTQYHIDLQTANLHWWQFKALFKSLNDTNMIIKIMEYRSMDLNQMKDKDQKRFYRKMKLLYKLPDERTEEEKERDMINSMEGIF